MLDNKGIKCTCLYIGSGVLENDIKAYATELKIDINILGFKNQSELPLYYSIADLLIVPSESETWGLVVNEALACGLRVVVSSEVGCAPDLIEDKITGMVYEKGNTKNLADAIEKLLDIKVDPTIWDKIKKKISQYSLNKAVEGIKRAVSYVTQ